MNISYSRVQAYLSCPYSHYLQYEIGVYAKKPQRPLYFGSDFHRLLELRLDPEELEAAKQEITDTYYEIPAHWQSDLGENYLENLFSIFEDYCKIYANDKTPQITEHEFCLPMFTHKAEPYFFKGKIDEIYKRRDSQTKEKYIIIGEHKTFSKRPSLSSLTMNTQKNLYAKAVQLIFGILPRSVIWDYICSRAALEPIWLTKSKRFSIGKSQQITPFSWVRACETYNIKNPAVLAQSKMFTDNINNFFFRIEQGYENETVDQIWQEFQFQARLIARYGGKNKTKHLTWQCNSCSYYDLCYTELTGRGRETLMLNNYVVKSRTDVETTTRQVIDPFFSQFEEVEHDSKEGATE